MIDKGKTRGLSPLSLKKRSTFRTVCPLGTAYSILHFYGKRYLTSPLRPRSAFLSSLP